MKNVSIYEKKWLDLVFEGKNKEYGAYQLRQDDQKTSVKAFLFGATLLTGVLGLGILFSSFSDKPVIAPKPSNPTKLVHVVTHPKKNDVEKKQEPIKKEKTKVETPDNKHYVAVEKEKAQPNVPTNIDSKTPNTLPVDNSGGNGGKEGPKTGVIPSGGNVGGGEIIKKTEVPLEVDALDRLPMFPGGMNKFYEYVGNNFEKTELEEDATIRIMISFVIEENGSMTNIKVLNKTNEEADAEAIRVLKSLKTKWTPGILNKEPVRTQYTLPIVVKS